MTKDKLIKIIKENTLGLSNEEAILTALEAYLSASNDGEPIVSRRFDRCSTCKKNIPGVEAGLWCITNCIAGSRYEAAENGG